MFYLTVQSFLASPTNIPRVFNVRFHVVSIWNTRGVFVGRVLTYTTYGKCLLESIMAVLTPKSGIVGRRDLF